MTRMPARVRLGDEPAEQAEIAERRVDVVEVGDVVPAVALRRRVERQQPERGDAELLEVVELRDQPGEVAPAVVGAVEEGAHVELVDDRVHVPVRVGRQCVRLADLARRRGGRALRRRPPVRRAPVPRDLGDRGLVLAARGRVWSVASRPGSLADLLGGVDRRVQVRLGVVTTLVVRIGLVSRHDRRHREHVRGETVGVEVDPSQVAMPSYVPPPSSSWSS